MQSQLHASATSAGSLFSSHTFRVPDFQREYAWEQEDYEEFWRDLKTQLDKDDSYFLGLVILTEGEDSRKQVVDGQQRLLTITLLATALRREALANRRKGLAYQIESTFLKALDYESDEHRIRIELTDANDRVTLDHIINQTTAEEDSQQQGINDSLGSRLQIAFAYLLEEVSKDISSDPFVRLGLWAKFLTEQLFFAVFVHPDPAAAFRVFEVINTRGRELTTSDLLKNYLLSTTTSHGQRAETYSRWKAVAGQLDASLVLYIRHVVSVRQGYILPKNLYDFLSQRRQETKPPPVEEVLEQMERWLPLYLQMLDPSLDGPAKPNQLKIFEALQELGVVAVRPLLMAMTEIDREDEGFEYVLRVVVRRTVVGNLGTSGAERRFSDAAKEVSATRDWQAAQDQLQSLDASRDDFVEQLKRRSLNKNVLKFIRRCVVQSSRTPKPEGYLHLIRPRSASSWPKFDNAEFASWGSTIGNVLMCNDLRRPPGADTWDGAKANLLPTAVDNEWRERLEKFESWTASSVQEIGREVAEAAADVWY